MNYFLKRVLHFIPILIGVNIITFALFFFVNSPDDIARMHLGTKYVTVDAINNWKRVHGYHYPLFYNKEALGLKKITQTIFYQKSIKLFVFDFGLSDNGRDIAQTIKDRYFPSLVIALPALVFSLFCGITFAFILAFFRATYLDTLGIFLCVILISISSLFYMIGIQYIFSIVLRWFPISGYVDGIYSIRFIILPIAVTVIAGLGGETRWYRALFLEELDKDYVKTARAKGLSDTKLYFKHILRNALIPILTSVVSVIPFLFMGSLLTESFFGIPGLGSYTIDAIRQQDFAIVRSMVFLGTILYFLGLLLTDLFYVLVDPRVRL